MSLSQLRFSRSNKSRALPSERNVEDKAQLKKGQNWSFVRCLELSGNHRDKYEVQSTKFS
jgi:hypothetical protein